MELTLREIRRETSDCSSFLFESQRPLNWQAGQYFKYTLPHADTDERGDTRYFSISSAPHERRVMLTTRFAERGSSFKRALRNLKPGDVINADELDGDFVVNDPRRDYIFVAGGIGITPFRAILLDLDHRDEPIHVSLLFANRNDEFPYKAELEQLRAKHARLHIEYFLRPRRIEEKVIRQYQERMRDPLIYVSGPEPMVEAFDKMLAQMGIPESQIKNDFFPGYDWPGDETSMRPMEAGKA
jgi:ferredoxin-NADP reductase